MSPEEAEIAAAKAALRARGWLVRYMEWTTGHQVVLHRRSETAVHRVTGWCASELDAWREALSLVVEQPGVREGARPANQDLGDPPSPARAT